LIKQFILFLFWNQQLTNTYLLDMLYIEIKMFLNYYNIIHYYYHGFIIKVKELVFMILMNVSWRISLVITNRDANYFIFIGQINCIKYDYKPLHIIF